MKEILILILIALAIYIHAGQRRDEFKEACFAKGGETVFAHYEEYCIKPGSLIDIYE